MADVNTIWSQAGVGFTFVQSERPVASDALVRATGNDEIDAIHALSGYANYIDVLLVDRRIDNSDPADPQNVAGETWAKSQDLGVPNVIVSANYMPAADVPGAKRRSRARTIAHELMHYLLDWDGSMHDGRSNLSLGLYGDSELKRDLNDDDVDRQRQSAITPLKPDGQ